jgi:D-ribose pyranase
MKRGGILSSRLAGATARLGHTDLVVVCDAGLPIPPGPEVVDLAFVPGVPTFGRVLSGLLEELVVEGATPAQEVVEADRETYDLLVSSLPELELVPDEDLERRVEGARLVVRTGAYTLYANVILRCGAPF